MPELTKMGAQKRQNLTNCVKKTQWHANCVIFTRNSTQNHMTKNIRFFKISEGPERGWFADVPNHTLAENEMVSGSDVFLETVDYLTGGDGEVFLTVSDDNAPGKFLAKLTRKQHDGAGATYRLGGPLPKRYGATGVELWICNVTHDVLGEHPETIYLHQID